jgi:uncharacterized membrane protein YkoI
MKPRVVSPAFLLITVTLLGCQNGSSPAQSGGTRFDPPSTAFRDKLNLVAPVTREEAMAIAAEAAGGTALSAVEETEGGALLFEVKVQTAAGRKEVEVRASDGAVVEIEPDDND